MASINKVILVGNLGRDPETRYAPSGDAICNVSIATTDRWRDKTSGEMKELTEWHRVVFFGKQAEIAGQYLRKGRQVYIEGSLRTRKWQDKDGQERYTTEIRADVMQMLGTREGMGDASPMRAPDEGGSDYNSSRPVQTGQSNSTSRPASNPPPASSSNLGDFDDDIPF